MMRCFKAATILLMIRIIRRRDIVVGAFNQLLCFKVSSISQYGNKPNPVHQVSKLERLMSVDELSNLPKGKPDGYVIVQHYSVPSTGFKNPSESGLFKEEDLLRLGINSRNMTLPSALMMLNTEKYPTLQHALLACRNKSVLVHRGPRGVDGVFELPKCHRGRVSDRIFPSDVLAEQVEIGGYLYNTTHPPPIELPVIYEDDHLAIVNKPAGIEVYAHPPVANNTKEGGITAATNTIRDILPFVLKPPRQGTSGIMSRPQAVHRLDKPTSGLLVVAKTRAAMADLSRQFADRVVQKTYTAICNGIPIVTNNSLLSTSDALSLGIDVEEEATCNGGNTSWNLIDQTLDKKQAVTAWRTCAFFKYPNAKNNTLTLVELKPKTGRYHQLRRHMAKATDSPLVGDYVYDGGALSLRKHGIFLCSNALSIEHPFYNTAIGRELWEEVQNSTCIQEHRADCMVQLSECEISNRVMLHVQSSLPEEFHSFLNTLEQI